MRTSPRSDRRLDVLAVGEALVVLAGAHVGLLGEESQLRIETGGAELNVAIALSRLGLCAAWAGAISRDELGRHVLRRLRSEDLDTSMVNFARGPTGVMFKQQRTTDRVSVEYLRRGSAGSRWRADTIINAGFGGARWLHMSGVTPALSPQSARESLQLLGRARDAGVNISFDVNFRERLWTEARASPVLLALIAQADLVFADEREAELVGLEPRHGARGLPPGAEVVLRGDGQVTACSAAGGFHELSWNSVPGADPVGAGDAFAAGYLHAKIGGRPVPVRLEAACALGRWAAQTQGGHANLPYDAEFSSSPTHGEQR